MVLANTDDCSNGDVRLQDGTHESNGRVEVCSNGIWTSVCSEGWSNFEAHVICKQLNFDFNGWLLAPE